MSARIEQQMDGKTTLLWVYSAAFGRVGRRSSPSSRPGREPASGPGGGGAPILVLLLSLGLWALIWGAGSLLAGYRFG